MDDSEEPYEHQEALTATMKCIANGCPGIPLGIHCPMPKRGFVR